MSRNLSLKNTVYSLIALIGILPSQAVLFASESFEDISGNIDAKGSGTGWSSTWVATSGSNRTIESDTVLSQLTTPAGTSNANVGSYARSVGGGYSEGYYHRLLTNTLDMDADGNTYYLSWLGKLGGSDSANAVGFGQSAGAPFNDVNASSPTNINFAFGNYYRDGGGFLGNGPFAISQNKGPTGNTILESTKTTSGPYSVINTTYMMVAKITTSSTSNDTVQLTWFSQDDTVTLTESWMLNGSADLTGIYDYLYMTLGGFSNSQVDEIRVGSDWLSVTGAVVPEPSNSNLALLSLATLVSFKRKRS